MKYVVNTCKNKFLTLSEQIADPNTSTKTVHVNTPRILTLLFRRPTIQINIDDVTITLYGIYNLSTINVTYLVEQINDTSQGW